VLETSKNLTIRADACAEIGSGHVMRCLALAQAWQDAGGEATFVSAMKSPRIEARLKSEGIEVVHLESVPGCVSDADETRAVADQQNALWIVVDGYQFDGNYQRRIRESGRKLLSIDDYGHADHYYADIVLNQNIHANANLYSKRQSYTNLLLGTRFVLLRREFLKWQGWKRDIPPIAKNILLTFGGSDNQNITCRVIQALKQTHLNGTEICVIAGLTNPRLEDIRRKLTDSHFNFKLLSSVNDMAALMAWADLAVSASGSTCWELAFMGLPSLILPLADNQVGIAEELDRKRAAIRLEVQELDSSPDMASRIGDVIRSCDTRSMITENEQKLVDGEGSERALMYMRGEKLRLRKVREPDCKLLWEWVNDPDVRLSAFSSEPIPWDIHVRWVSERLRKSDSFLFIALDDQDVPLGQIRFDIDESKAQIDVSIDKGKRGLGCGPILIEKGVQELFRKTPIKEVHAFVKVSNESSIRAFEKAKFGQVGVEIVKGNRALHYLRERKNA
jgi:UDP-2,4-diacetamido-2,4,6-trideoxy-beta-L-altropyranose hydrolase